MAEFRRARIGDAEGIAQLLLANYRIETEDEAIHVFKKEFVKGHNFIVALEGEKILGFASWSKHGLTRHRLAWMNRFATLPEVSFEVQEGLFTQAVQDADKTFKEEGVKLRKIFVFCHLSNKRMQECYEKIGLVKEAVLKDHFYQGEDEIVYSMFYE